MASISIHVTLVGGTLHPPLAVVPVQELNPQMKPSISQC